MDELEVGFFAGPAVPYDINIVLSGNGDVSTPSFSPDHTKLLFATNVAFDPSDHDVFFDLYLRPASGGTPTIVPNTRGGFAPSWLNDTQFVYQKPSGPLTQIFVRDIGTGIDTPLSASGGVLGNGSSFSPVLSFGKVGFSSFAQNLTGDPTSKLHSLVATPGAGGAPVVVDRASDGSLSNGFSTTPVLTLDGLTAFFSSTGTNLIAGDTNGFADIFKRDIATGVTTRAVNGPGGAQPNGDSSSAVLSLDGKKIAFSSTDPALDSSGFKFDEEADGCVYILDVATGGCPSCRGRLLPRMVSRWKISRVH